MTDTHVIITPDFLVNTNTGGDQNTPSVTGLVGGGFVVTWSSPGLAGTGADYNAVRAQVFSAAGAKIGNEFVVNTQTMGLQWEPSVTALAGGGFAIAWRDDNGANAIMAQVFTATGTKVGPERAVNTATTGVQFDAMITGLSDGGFIVTWVSPFSGGSRLDVKGQRFDASGTKIGSELLLHAGGRAPSAAGLDDGSYVVTWGDAGGTIGARIFAADGTPVGAEFTVNAATTGSSETPEVTKLSTGGFVITWTESGNIHAQMFSAAGAKVGGDIVVSAPSTYVQYDPAIAATRDGGFIVTWTHDTMHENDEDYVTTYPYIQVRHFDATGTPYDSGLTFGDTSQYYGWERETAIAAMADGGYVIVRSQGADYGWEFGDDRDGTGVRADLVIVMASDGVPTSGHDSLTGTAGNDLIDALGGTDVINGLAGNDTLIGGTGDDGLFGDDGNDSLSGGDGFDTLAGGAGDDVASGGAQDDTVWGGAGNDSLSGGDGNDGLYGEDGNDTLRGDAGSDTLHGDAGNDVLEGGGGGDFVDGGDGNDTIVAQTGDLASGGFGDDYITGRGYSLGGGYGDDTIMAWASAGTVSGGDGDDVISVDIGLDTIAPGDGRDVLSIRPEFSAIGGTLSVWGFEVSQDVLSLGALFAGFTNYGGGDPFASGHLSWMQSGYDAVLRVDVDGSAGAGALRTVLRMSNISVGEITSANLSYSNTPTQDADLLIGTAGNDSLDGLGGSDWIKGMEGDDTLKGGDGEDSLDGGEGNDSIDGGAGFGWLRGRGGNDTLTGGAAQDSLDGGDGNDVLDGGAGNDTMAGGAGDDTLKDGEGIDAFYGEGGNDLIRLDGVFVAGETYYGGEGNDTLVGYGDLTVATIAGIEQINLRAGGYDLKATLAQLAGIGSFTYGGVIGAGGDGSTIVLADRGTVDFTGKAQTGLKVRAFDINSFSASQITGTQFDDTLIGGIGNDILTGGAGDDRYVVGVGGRGDHIAAGSTGAANDVLEITGGLTIADVRFLREGNDLFIRYGLASSDSVRLLNHFAYDGTTQVKTLEIGGVAYDLTQGLSFNGSSGTDNLRGGAFDDAITAHAGDDKLYGLEGNDTLKGNTGNDTLEGGAGNDRYLFAIGDGQDLIVTPTVAGDADVIEITTKTLTIDGVRFERSGDDLVIGVGPGTDSLRLANHFTSAVKVSTIIVGGVTYSLIGNPAIEGTAGADTLTGTVMNDTISGLAGADSIDGLSGNDSLLGGERWDTLKGGQGNDTLDGGLDNDAMYGGAGDDLYYVDNAGDRTFELLNEGIDSVISTLSWSLSADVEHLTLTGTALTGTGNGLANRIIGNELANTLSGGASADTLDGGAGADSLDGGIGNDSLLGGARWDTLIGGDGNDTLDGGLDNDQMYGGFGDDVYYVDHVGDRVNEATGENQGIDTVYATVGWNMTANVEHVVFTGAANAASVGNSLHNTMNGNAGNNTLSGGSGHDTINGGDGNDSIDGGTESDVLDGGAGNDTILGGQRWDTLVGGDGDDVLDGGTENDRMTGGAGNDTYYIDHIGDRVIEVAGEGIDTVYTSLDWAMAADVETLVLTGAAVTGTGNGLNNRMTGNTNANVLNGGNGNDTLIGGQGADTLTGGTGRDDFVFSASNGTDRIADFVHGIDRLVFTGVDYGFAGGYRLTAAQFTTGPAAVGTAAQFVWDAATGHLYWDADGTGAGAAIDLAVFDGTPGLTKDDFYFV